MNSEAPDNPYAGPVWRRFCAPSHAGLPAGEEVVTAQVSTPAADAVLQLAIRLENGEISEAGFLARGCPEVIAAGQIICEEISHKPLNIMNIDCKMTIENELGLGPEKRYCRLLVEDALAALRAQVPTP